MKENSLAITQFNKLEENKQREIKKRKEKCFKWKTSQKKRKQLNCCVKTETLNVRKSEKSKTQSNAEMKITASTSATSTE